MNRLYLAGLSLAIAVCSLPSVASAQDPAQLLDHYRLLPRQSTLQQTGGIAGFNFKYRLIGEYDLLHRAGWDSPADQILNLEGLTGQRLPVAAPFDVYQFKGNTSDGSSVNLLASVIGPWMYLRGGTQPPPGSADYFTYRLQALARSSPFADFNDDGVVDGADFVMYRNSAGTPASGLATGAGIAEWRQQFGESVPDLGAMDMMLSAAMGSGGAVPEPASWVFVLICGVISAVVRWRKR